MDKRKGSRLCIESSGASAALHEAIRSVAYNGKVVASGFYQGDAIGLRLGEEFHHNRVQVLCSQIQAVSPEISYRWDRLRMEQTIMQLQGSGKLHLMPLITHQYAFEEAAKAYELLDRQTEEHLQVVLTFTDK